MTDPQRVAELAIMSAGVVNDERRWNLAVAKNTAMIAAMLREPHDPELATTPLVTARKIAESSVFKAEYVGFDVEENTKRLIVKVRSETGDDKERDADGVEEMRTEPWWTDAGFMMKRAIEHLEVGTPINVYKYIEPIDNGRKKVRVLVHFEVIGKPRPAEGSSRPAPSAGRAQRAEPPTPPAAPPPAPGGHADLIATRFEALSPRQRVAFGRLCGGQGLTDFMDPPDEHLDAVLLALSTIEKNNEGAS